MVPVLRERSAWCEELRMLPPETVAEIRSAGFPRIAQPTRFGGMGLLVDDAAEVAMELGRGCCSTSWVSALYSGHNFLVSLFSEEAQKEYWGVLCTTASAMVSMDFADEPGGYRISGHWRYSSGCDYADWLILFMATGMYLLPKSDFRIEDDWHVMGLRGTGSKAIVLDNVVMGNPPVINGAIGTRGQITMGQGRDLQAAQDLSLVLKAGALPVALKVAEVRNIGPSLGADSINKALTAGIIAILLVVAIMLGYYRFSGMLAVAGLALYVLYTLAVLAGFDAVLTVPGLAGFVLSIGIAVDANVLIFKRIREELDRGKTVRTAIDEGFHHAQSAIIDTSVSTILTAAVLYQYGTGPVKGFAVTLIAGIIASMFTAIFVVKTFYLLWLNRTRGAQTLSI